MGCVGFFLVFVFLLRLCVCCLLCGVYFLFCKDVWYVRFWFCFFVYWLCLVCG